jgi:MoaA/NifB/PqqE/SkfB family radical SAM enzyme
MHCYSSSGPQERAEVDLTVLREAVTDASDEGYTVVGISGGEPLLYKPLRPLLCHARECGMITTVTSNGMLLDERRLETLQGAVDLLAISLDGVPTSHNRNRASERAFETMASRLEGVRRTGIPFGFIFTLTQHNLHELDWVADFALDQGARLLQVHPLEEVGRAKRFLVGASPDEVEAAYAHLEALRIQASAGNRLRVQLDLLDRDLIRSNPGRIYANRESSDPAKSPLSDLVAPLVIEADGTVVPIQHGFSRGYALGNLQEASLGKLATRWRRAGYRSFRNLCLDAFEEITASAQLPFVNWYDVISRRSRSAAGALT